MVNGGRKASHRVARVAREGGGNLCNVTGRRCCHRGGGIKTISCKNNLLKTKKGNRVKHKLIWRGNSMEDDRSSVKHKLI